MAPCSRSAPGFASSLKALYTISGASKSSKVPCRCLKRGIESRFYAGEVVFREGLELYVDGRLDGQVAPQLESISATLCGEENKDVKVGLERSR